MEGNPGQVIVTEVSALSLMRLMHLASPTLPVGAYSYSQGLESAVDAGIVTDESGARRWITDVLTHSMARLEAPVFCRFYRAWGAMDIAAISHWSAWFLASRDSAEFRAETVQMGYSLARLLRELFPNDSLTPLLSPVAGADLPYPGALGAACVMLGTPLDASLGACLFSWAENQVLAAIKAVPLGQVAGQRLLFALEQPLLNAAATALVLKDHELSNWTPGLSLLSMRHETQPSRLFRS